MLRKFVVVSMFLAVVGLVLGSVGCKKEEPAKPAAPKEEPKAAEPVADAAKEEPKTEGAAQEIKEEPKAEGAAQAAVADPNAAPAGAAAEGAAAAVAPTGDADPACTAAMNTIAKLGKDAGGPELNDEQKKAFLTQCAMWPAETRTCLANAAEPQAVATCMRDMVQKQRDAAGAGQPAALPDAGGAAAPAGGAAAPEGGAAAPAGNPSAPAGQPGAGQ
ncbi:MAG: hypothetical protein HUU55_15600 [Myxococcales bacterium]|nr:hypothetical protein [Myxococcales bacterium]